MNHRRPRHKRLDQLRFDQSGLSQAGPGQAGFTLIELLIAGALLVFGILTMAGLIGLAVKNNGHNRLDSTATMLNQAVVEQVSSGIAYVSFGGTGTATLTDCVGNAWPVDSLGPGAHLQTTGVNTGYIDFTESKSDANLKGYQMDYVVCNGNTRVTYDVRWNISALAPTGITSFTHILTVGTRLESSDTTQQSNQGIINFPINMRMMVGPDPY